MVYNSTSFVIRKCDFNKNSGCEQNKTKLDEVIKQLAVSIISIEQITNITNFDKDKTPLMTTSRLI